MNNKTRKYLVVSLIVWAWAVGGLVFLGNSEDFGTLGEKIFVALGIAATFLVVTYKKKLKEWL